MTIGPRTTEYQGSSDPSWLGSAHGTDATRTITLDGTKFTAATHAPLGFIKSGTHLAQVTATKIYGAYDKDDTTTGLGVCVGFLYGDHAFATGDTKIPAALLDHGRIRESRLPFTIDATGKTDVAGRIQFI